MAATMADGNSDVTTLESKMITLISSDGQRFDMEEEAAAMSKTISHMIDDDCVKQGVMVPNIKSGVLTKVIEYSNKHVIAANSNNTTSASDAGVAGQHDLKSFDTDFVNVDQHMLFELIHAANYLDIKELLDLSCQTIADMVKDKTLEVLCEIFGLVNDFTLDEKEEVLKENAWAFE